MSRLQFTPKPHQPLGIGHIIDRPRCALWADLGMGKGVMALTALDDVSVTEDVYPVLALGPKRVARDVWPDEAAKWDHLSHLSCVPIVGSPEQRLRALKTDAPVYSVNYENVPWLVEHWGERWPYKTVIADEARKLASYRGGFRTHPKTGKVYLQSGGGQRARALAKITHGGKVKRFIELTGKPAPQGFIDLWGQVWYLDAGERLGRSFDGFSKRWFRTGYNGFGYELLPHAETEINEKIADLCLTIDPKDWYDLKEPIVANVYVDLPKQARALYRDMEREMFARLGDSTVEAFGAAAKTQKCLQMANGAVYIDQDVTDDSNPRSKEWRVVHDEKMDALDSIISEANGAALIIVYSFRSDRARIMKAHPEAVDLAVAEGERKFKAGKATLGVAHAASIGHGVDGFQKVCNHIVHFGHGWSLDEYDQINGRIGPMRQMQAGFDRPVFHTHIVARGTVDEDVMERRDTKRSVQEILLNAMKRRNR